MLKGVLGEGYLRGRDGVCTVAAPGVVRGMGDGVRVAGYRLTVSFCVVAPAGVRTRTM
jgi:hypothetical protein